MGGGSSQSDSESRPVDMTPPEFRELRQPFADVVAQLLGFGPMQSQPAQPARTGARRPNAQRTGAVRPDTGRRMVQRAGSMPTGPGYIPNENMPNMTGTGARPAQPGGGTGTGPGGTGFTQSPYGPTGDPSDPLRGFPQYQGDLVADMTGNEAAILQQMMRSGTQRNQTINQAARGGLGNSYAQMGRWNFNDIMADPSIGTHELDFDTEAYDRAADPFAEMQFGTDNPFLEEAITAAQRSTMTNLEETLGRTLPSMFTRAGHMIQYDPEAGVGGSSAFNRAAAVATRGAAQEMGDIAGEMSFQAFDAERNRQLAAIDAQQNRILQSITDDRSMEAQFQNAELQRQADALEAEKQRILAGRQSERAMAFEGRESRANRRMQGAQLSQQEVQTQVQNLQAQALPRLIADLGIERGMEQFNNRMNALMILLQTAGGVGSPTVSNVSTGSTDSRTKPTMSF